MLTLVVKPPFWWYACSNLLDWLVGELVMAGTQQPITATNIYSHLIYFHNGQTSLDTLPQTNQHFYALKKVGLKSFPKRKSVGSPFPTNSRSSQYVREVQGEPQSLEDYRAAIKACPLGKLRVG